MESTKKKMRVLTSKVSTRGMRYIRLDDEEDRFPSLTDEVAYWQGSDLQWTPREILNLMRSKLYDLYGEKIVSNHLVPVSKEDFRKLSNDVKQVKVTVKQLCDEVQELRGTVPKVVVLEEISKKEARKLIEGYFKKHGQADVEELMLNLKIPVRNIVEIIDDMKNEGKLVPREEEKT